MSSRVQYKTLTFAEKVAVIREVEKGVKKKYQIAKDYGIAPNTLSSFLKNKDKILSNFSSGNVKDRKRAREPDNPEVDECVLKWFKQARDKAIPLSGPLLQAKEEEFSASLG
jgi:transposase-like protein